MQVRVWVPAAVMRRAQATMVQGTGPGSSGLTLTVLSDFQESSVPLQVSSACLSACHLTQAAHPAQLIAVLCQPHTWQGIARLRQTSRLANAQARVCSLDVVEAARASYLALTIQCGSAEFMCSIRAVVAAGLMGPRVCRYTQEDLLLCQTCKGLPGPS